VPDDPIPGEVRQLVARHVRTMEQVEVLLLLARGSERALSADEIRAALRLDQNAVAATSLAGLEEGRLIEEQPGHPPRWRYAPATPELRRAVELLAVAYNERPVTLVRMIYERPSAVQSFADAFRIRRDDEP
jgi:hypothetical protein